MDSSLYLHRDSFLHVIDLDNNGVNDLLLTFSKNPLGKNASGAIAWLRDQQNHFSLLHNRNPPTGMGETADWVGPYFFFSSRRRHTRFDCDWSSDVCSSD